MRLVERMVGSPPNCMHCGRGNVPDEQGKIGPFLDMEREVNWGDDAYLCEDCATAIGLMFGLTDGATVQEMERTIRRLEREKHDLESKITKAQEREKTAQREANTLKEADALREAHQAKRNRQKVKA